MDKEWFFYLVDVTVTNNYRILLSCGKGISQWNFSDFHSKSVGNKCNKVNPHFIPRKRLNSQAVQKIWLEAQHIVQRPAAASYLRYYMWSASKKEAVAKFMWWNWEALMYINSYFAIYHTMANLWLKFYQSMKMKVVDTKWNTVHLDLFM